MKMTLGVAVAAATLMLAGGIASADIAPAKVHAKHHSMVKTVSTKETKHVKHHAKPVVVVAPVKHHHHYKHHTQCWVKHGHKHCKTV